MEPQQAQVEDAACGRREVEVIGRQQLVRADVVEEGPFPGSGHRHDVGIGRGRLVGSVQLSGVDAHLAGLFEQEVTVGVVAQQADRIDRHGCVEFADVDTEVVGRTTTLLIGRRDPSERLLVRPLVDQLDAINCPRTATDETAPFGRRHDISTGSVISRSSGRLR